MHALVLAAALDVLAQDPASTASTLGRARAAEEALRFDEALAGYIAIADAVPEARARAAWLEARRTAGFAPLRALESVRRSAGRASSLPDVDALARDAETFPPGVVRLEAKMFVATAYLGRLGRGARGRELLRSLTAEPDAEPELRARALGMLVRSSVDDGHLAEARGDVARFGDAVPADARALLAARVRRFVVTLASMGALLGVALGLGAALARAPRRTRSGGEPPPGATKGAPPLGAAWGSGVAGPGVLGCAVVASGGALAVAYDGNAARAVPFVVLALALAPLLLAARAWSALGASTRRARFGRALVCGAAGLGLAVLILERIEPTYLEGFGL